ncbi:hypothetical protein [Pseudomonas aeruginosa]|uniref:hypothetical protein n=1 Tax=Pseudomonas aeruginosa TaxID=287 RepID=UPI003460ADB1
MFALTPITAFLRSARSQVGPAFGEGRPLPDTSTAETRSPAPSARAYMRDGRPISTPWRISICCP